MKKIICDVLDFFAFTFVCALFLFGGDSEDKKARRHANMQTRTAGKGTIK